MNRVKVKKVNDDAKDPPTNATAILAIICVAALSVGVGLVIFGTKPNTGFGDAGAVLVFAGLAAVAIERIIEGFWIVAEKYAGKFWPFSDAVKRLNDLTEAMNATIKPAIDAASEGIDKTNAQLTEAKNALDQLQNAWNTEYEQFKKHLPDNQRVEQLSTIGFQAAGLAQQFSSKAAVPAAVAQQAVSGAVDFLATFKDNPAKRMVSSVVGVSLGLMMAGVTGLDLLSAALAEPSATATGSTLGVLISGIVIGLGSGPTHTVISTLSEIRNSRRTQTQALPNVSAAESPQVVVVPSVPGPAPVGPTLDAFARAMEGAGVRSELIAAETADLAAEIQGSRPPAASTPGAGTVEIPRVSRPSTLMLRR